MGCCCSDKNEESFDSGNGGSTHFRYETKEIYDYRFYIYKGVKFPRMFILATKWEVLPECTYNLIIDHKMQHNKSYNYMITGTDGKVLFTRGPKPDSLTAELYTMDPSNKTIKELEMYEALLYLRTQIKKDNQSKSNPLILLSTLEKTDTDLAQGTFLVNKLPAPPSAPPLTLNKLPPSYEESING